MGVMQEKHHAAAKTDKKSSNTTGFKSCDLTEVIMRINRTPQRNLD